MRAMDVYTGLDPEAKELVQRHEPMLARLPRTFLVNTLLRIEKWPSLFDAEKRYFRALLEQLSALNSSQFEQMFGALAAFEKKTGCGRLDAKDPATLQQEQLEYLRRQGSNFEWRRLIEAIFQKLEPMVEARLYSSDLPPRLVVLIYSQGITIERETLWERFRETGIRVPLALGSAQTTAPFLTELLTGRPAIPGAKPAATLFRALDHENVPPLDKWLIEAGEELHLLCERNDDLSRLGPCATGLSYQRLRAYRRRLSEAIYSKVSSGGMQGPVELAHWLETLEARPHEGLSLYHDRTVLDFVRDLLVLGGNGTLIINNSFVEWSSVQTLHRAQPRLLVARFGVRDKLKPFSSLLLFSQPRRADKIPLMQDPLGSFVDAELESYYIWLKSSNELPYRGKTLYLLLAEGVDQMLAVPPSSPSKVANLSLPNRVSLSDVNATMAAWLGLKTGSLAGRPIPTLLS
jgi:hypothetical protein